MHENLPVVSILLAFRNDRVPLRKAIESVIAQTGIGWELILVDDGSSDASYDVALWFQTKNPDRLRVLSHPGRVNVGTGASLRLALEQARGEMVALFDVRNRWHPELLHERVAVLQEYPSAVAVIRDPSSSVMSVGVSSLWAGTDVLLRHLDVDPTSLFADAVTRSSPLQKHSQAGDEALLLYSLLLEGDVVLTNSTDSSHSQLAEPNRDELATARRFQRLQRLADHLDERDIDDPTLRTAIENRLRASRLERRPASERIRESVVRAIERALRGANTLVRRVGGRSTGQIDARPNPAVALPADVRTTIRWTAQSTSGIEVHIDAPDGPLFATGESTGRQQTGNWLRDGMTFFLQDTSGGLPLERANTIDRVRVAVRDPVQASSRGSVKVRASGRRLAVLMYHRIAEASLDPWRLAVTPSNFAEQLDVIRSRASPMSLSDALQGLREKRLPERAVVLTFDDGYRDNYDTALPLLEKYEVPATVFITSGAVGSERLFWWDEIERLLLRTGLFPEELNLVTKERSEWWPLVASRQYSEIERELDREWIVHRNGRSSARFEFFRSVHRFLEELLADERAACLDAIRMWSKHDHLDSRCAPLVTTDELIGMSRHPLLEIGGHTVTHAHLPWFPREVQRDEIERGKSEVEEVIGRSIHHFAYPHGAFDDDTVRLVRGAGFDSAYSVDAGLASFTSDSWRLPRIKVTDDSGDAFVRYLEDSWSR